MAYHIGTEWGYFMVREDHYPFSPMVFSASSEELEFCCGVKVVGDFECPQDLRSSIKTAFRDWVKSLGNMQVATLIDKQKAVVEPLLLFAGFKVTGTAINPNTKNRITLYTRCARSRKK